MYVTAIVETRPSSTDRSFYPVRYHATSQNKTRLRESQYRNQWRRRRTSGKPSFQRDLPRVTANNKTIKVAAELAAAHIPVILNLFRGAPWQWQNLDSLVGPPLTKSSAQVLAVAGVTFGIAMGGMSMFFSCRFRLKSLEQCPRIPISFPSSYYPAGAFAIYG